MVHLFYKYFLTKGLEGKKASKSNIQDLRVQEKHTYYTSDKMM